MSVSGWEGEWLGGREDGLGKPLQDENSNLKLTINYGDQCNIARLNICSCFACFLKENQTWKKL